MLRYSPFSGQDFDVRECRAYGSMAITKAAGKEQEALEFQRFGWGQGTSTADIGFGCVYNGDITN